VGSNTTDVCVLLFCVYSVLSIGSGLATRWSLVQEVLPSVKNDYETEEEDRAQQRDVEPLMSEKWMILAINWFWYNGEKGYTIKAEVPEGYASVVNLENSVPKKLNSVAFSSQANYTDPI
jgi:hypothetical protein